ncbi:MAG: KilA-N domain-containing protein [Methyloversatilis sp.]|nr:KilA-N domain-containing protein [Methyloversatilis sp.]
MNADAPRGRQPATREGHGAAFSASGAQVEGTFREDGYFNMTMAAKHFDKALPNVWKSPETKAYLAAASRSVKTTGLELVVTIPGNRYIAHWGTWAPPKLAVFFAR